MLDIIKLIWEFVLLFGEFIFDICRTLYDIFGVLFVMVVSFIIMICVFWVFGGLQDNYEEHVKYKNFKNLDKISKNLDKK